jgi:hypothetical protein
MASIPHLMASHQLAVVLAGMAVLAKVEAVAEVAVQAA